MIPVPGATDAGPLLHEADLDAGHPAARRGQQPAEAGADAEHLHLLLYGLALDLLLHVGVDEQVLPLLVLGQLADVLLLALGRLRVQPLVALLQILLLQELLRARL